jgi:hypothetical protein
MGKKKKSCDVDDDDDEEVVVDDVCNRNQAKYIYMVYLSINKDKERRIERW